ncbi:hypothetical protein SASPL_145083 [Salvia splendens]|uniref:Disease resistance protein RPM1 n=1 Tax=Salvia splendens TaxID=180675 RepID=A0A8X8Z7D2_SALSN|nr:hypothetical protein SASPL_145083 [Salvia splendens]
MEEYFLVQGLNENAKKLQMTLGMIRAYLNDAEKKFITQDSVKFWMRKLEALAFDADNVLDELSYQLLHKQVEKMKTLNPSPKAKLKLLSRFSSFSRISHLGLQSIVRYAPAVVDPTSTGTNSIKSDPIFVGRDADVSNVVDMSLLLSDMGKTTLTRNVFNHERLKTFGSHIWVHVSQTFDSIEGNGIIITSRSQKVASIVNPFHIHRVNGLSVEQCWSIIKTKTFDGNAQVPSVFETIGKEIAKRCQGLPLAANVAGGVLRCHKSERDWRSIKENWLPDGEGGRGIVKEELIELWMAEGFLQSIGGDDMESVGNIYFNVLLQNSLLQATQANYGWECFVMHDFVHDLASSVLYTSNTHSSTIVRYKFHENQSSRISEEVLRNLRTLLLRGGTSSTIFSDFKCLHNLTLYGREYKQLPISIKELIHLRNLNISGTSIVNIPER